MDETSPQRSRKTWPYWLIAAVVLIAGVYVFSQRSQASAQNSSNAQGASKQGGGRRGAGGPTPVGTATVAKGDIGVYINALGTVTPVYTVNLTSRVQGQLMEVHYREGQVVRKGDLLAVIDPRGFQAAVTQAQGQLARDQASLQNARLDLTRYQSAFEQHAIPAQTLNTQQAAVAQAEGTVKFDQGSLQAAEVNLDYTNIRAPISGRVGLRTVDPGNMVQASGTQTLATITQLLPITVIFPIAEDYVDEVAGQLRRHASLQVDALDRSSSTTLAHGTVLTIDNQVDTTTGTVRVRATFPNKDYVLFPNEFVNARLLVKSLMGVNLIPAAAIQRDNETTFVYVVDSADAVHSRNIQVATIDGDIAAATGVNTGETIVVDGFDRLVDGAKVHPQPAASFSGMNRSGAHRPQTHGSANRNQATQGQTGRARQGQDDTQPSPNSGPAQPGSQR